MHSIPACSPAIAIIVVVAMDPRAYSGMRDETLVALRQQYPT